MKGLSGFLSAACLAAALMFSGMVSAQPSAQPSAAAIASAKELLTLKHADAMYANAVPGMVERTKTTLLQSNLNYQKDLNEVALVVAKSLAGREKEIGDGMAKIYASQFTEQELKDLVTFYKSPLGQKLLAQEPKAIEQSMGYMNQWAQQFAEIVNGEFRSEMRKRGKEI
ncbi:DUF2059 domain-containing protein [Nitrobacter sp.]|jgi:hypothetical protein|uniref:DUF2059 domain-containing protein n=1 Tax=Nitrobacter sp. TaxID=29420 RepID=UPI003F65440B